MKRFIILVLPVLISVIVILIKVPDIETWLKKQDEQAGLLIALFLAASTILLHIITVYSPFKKYERIARNKWMIIEAYAERLIADLSTQGYQKVSFSLMTPKRLWWYHKLHPKTPVSKITPDSTIPEKLTRCWFGKVFKVEWRFGANFDKRAENEHKTRNSRFSFCKWGYTNYKYCFHYRFKYSEL